MRKTRVTKQQILDMKAERKITSQQRKQHIKPGPWSQITTDLTVECALRPHSSLSSALGTYYGAYLDDAGWTEKSWYPININLDITNIQDLIKVYDMSQILNACEKALNSKEIYGDVVLLGLGANNINNSDPAKRFISLRAKTNRKSIKGFRATREKKLVVL